MPKSTPKQAATTKVRLARNSTAGFTIVEVAVASMIMVLALCSCFSLMQMSFKALDTARTSTLAAQVMQSEIERLRLLNWSDLSSMVTTTPAPVDISTVYAGGSNATNRFTATRLINPTTGRETTMLDIQISISWRGLDGLSYSRSFKTKYSKNGLYDYFYTARPAS